MNGPTPVSHEVILIPKRGMATQCLRTQQVVDLLNKQRDDLLQKQKKARPSNIRIEVPLERSAFKNVRKELRGEIKKLFKER